MHYVDDARLNNPPESESGVLETGYAFDLTQLGRGEFPCQMYFYFPESYCAGDETVYLNILDKPLVWRIKKME